MMRTRYELLKMRQSQCDWKRDGYCPINDFEKCKSCKAIHTKPLGLAALIENGWEGIKEKQAGGKV